MDVDEASDQLANAIEFWTTELEGVGAVQRTTRSAPEVASDLLQELVDADADTFNEINGAIQNLCVGFGDEQISAGRAPEKWWATPLGRLISETASQD